MLSLCYVTSVYSNLEACFLFGLTFSRKLDNVILFLVQLCNNFYQHFWVSIFVDLTKKLQFEEYFKLIHGQ